MKGSKWMILDNSRVYSRARSKRSGDYEGFPLLKVHSSGFTLRRTITVAGRDAGKDVVMEIYRRDIVSGR